MKYFLVSIIFMALLYEVETTLRSVLTNVENFKPENKKNNTILIGVLIPMTNLVSSADTMLIGDFYASAMYVAIDDINNNKMLAPYHLQLVWADTECNTTRTLEIQSRFQKLGVAVVIYGGCGDCEIVARDAEQRNMAVISYSCDVGNLASKYNTFLETSLEFHHMFTFAVKEMMRYYKWHYVGVLVENVTNYKWCYEDLVRNVGADSFQMFYLKPVVLYSLTDDYSSLKNKISSFKDKVSIIIVLANKRVFKEVLIAAQELNMVNGDYAFMATMLDLHTRNRFHRGQWYLWSTVDYSIGGYGSYMERNWKLCQALKSTYLIAVKETINVPSSNYSVFEDKVRSGMKDWFNSYSYIGTIAGTKYNKSKSKPPSYASQMYDAITFYARAVKKLLNEGKEYKCGRNIRKYFINSKQTGIGYTYQYGNKGQLFHPLHFYHFRTQNETKDQPCHVTPKRIGDFLFDFSGNDILATYKTNVTINWPSKDDAKKKKRNIVAIVALTVIGILILMFVLFVLIKFCRTYRKPYYKASTKEDEVTLEEVTE